MPDYITGITVDESGQAIVTGLSASSNFPITPGAYQTVIRGDYDAFVTKFNSSASSLVFSTFVGGTDHDSATDIESMDDGSLIVSGYTYSSDFPTTSDAFSSTIAGPGDGFIFRLSSGGTANLYSTFFGSSQMDQIWAISLQSCGDLYIAGSTSGGNFPVRQAFQSSFQGVSDGFISKFTFLSTVSTAPDASVDGPFATAVSEYKLPAAVDSEVLD